MRLRDQPFWQVFGSAERAPLHWGMFALPYDFYRLFKFISGMQWHTPP